MLQDQQRCDQGVCHLPGPMDVHNLQDSKAKSSPGHTALSSLQKVMEGPTAKFLVIICSVHSKMASNTRGTSGAMSSRSLVMMAANRLRTSASLRTNTGSALLHPCVPHQDPRQPLHCWLCPMHCSAWHAAIIEGG